MSRTMLAATAVLATLVVGACYSPSLDSNGQFFCRDEAQLCPEGFVCKDELCVKKGTDPKLDSGPPPEDRPIIEEDIEPPPFGRCELGEETLISDCSPVGQFSAAIRTETPPTQVVTFTINKRLHWALQKEEEPSWVASSTEGSSNGYSAARFWSDELFIGTRIESGTLYVTTAKEDPVLAQVDSADGKWVSLAPAASGSVWVAYQARTSGTLPRHTTRVALAKSNGTSDTPMNIESTQGGELNHQAVSIDSHPRGGAHLAFFAIDSSGQAAKVFSSSYDRQKKNWPKANEIGDLSGVATLLRGVAVAVNEAGPHFVFPSPEGLIYHFDGLSEPMTAAPSSPAQPEQRLGRPSLALQAEREVVAFLTDNGKAMIVYRTDHGNWQGPTPIEAAGAITQVQVVASSEGTFEVFYRRWQKAETKATLFHRTLTCGIVVEPPPPPEPPPGN